MRKVKRKSSGTTSCGTIRLEVSLWIRCNIFLCGKNTRLKDMRCLNVPPEVMVRFVFMMSITPCAKMRVRNIIMGMMHFYDILASMSMSMVKNIMKTCSVTLTLPHSQPACSSFQCPIWKYSLSFKIQQKKFWNSPIPSLTFQTRRNDLNSFASWYFWIKDPDYMIWEKGVKLGVRGSRSKSPLQTLSTRIE